MFFFGEICSFTVYCMAYDSEGISERFYQPRRVDNLAKIFDLPGHQSHNVPEPTKNHAPELARSASLRWFVQRLGSVALPFRRQPSGKRSLQKPVNSGVLYKQSGA